MIFDVNAWVGNWPFRSLMDNTPEALVSRLDRSGIDGAAVSSIDALFHRNVQPANEKLAEAVIPFEGRLVPLATLNPTYPKWEDDLRDCHEKLGMAGVRLFPPYQGYEVDGPETRRVLAACKARGLPVFIPHRMEDPRQRHWMDPRKVVDLNAVANLIAAEPEATVVVPNARGIARTALWQREDVRDLSWYVDLSLMEVHYVLHRNLSTIKDGAALTGAGGAKHLLFGTHLPFSYAGAALVKLAVLPVDEETLKDIRYRSAEKILGIRVEKASAE